jgi:hypothetical protein
MPRFLSAISLVLVVLAASSAALAEVKTVRMHIAGYLCGN